MATIIRPEISRKNTYYVNRERYLELTHFCRQYKTWKKELNGIDGMSAKAPGISERVVEGKTSDPTSVYAIAREYYIRRIGMVEEAAKSATNELYSEAMILSVTEGLAYEKLEARGAISCGRRVWYTAYRRFFWILDKLRK